VYRLSALYSFCCEGSIIRLPRKGKISFADFAIDKLPEAADRLGMYTTSILRELKNG
jgi:hypothetical protein